MRTIEAKAIVTSDGTHTIQVPPDIRAGEHRVVVVIEELPVKDAERPPLNFPVDHYGSWPDDLSLRREDMYNDNGR